MASSTSSDKLPADPLCDILQWLYPPPPSTSAAASDDRSIRACRQPPGSSNPNRPNGLVVASSFDKLPTDMLSYILLRFTAKELCRLRTVCRSWRSLISDATFIEVHAERHKETLFLAKFQDDDRNIYVVDLSGDVVKRIAGADGGHRVQRTSLKLACLSTQWNSCRLLNPATSGHVRVLPHSTALYYMNGLFLRNRCTVFALGMVASTDEYKLLRCWLGRPFMEMGHHQVEVLTINGGTDWRQTPGPRCFLDTYSAIAVDGTVYFLTLFSDNNDTPADNILSFDLANEEWRDLHGPLSSDNVTSAEVMRSQLSLADLKGSLVLAHHRRHMSTVDLWFLLDFESELWVKEYNIQTESITPSLADICQIIPLLALQDGRLIIYLAPVGLLFICDPGTNTFTRVHMRGRLDSVGVYTGSLLNLQPVAGV